MYLPISLEELIDKNPPVRVVSLMVEHVDNQPILKR